MRTPSQFDDAEQPNSEQAFVRCAPIAYLHGAGSTVEKCSTVLRLERKTVFKKSSRSFLDRLHRVSKWRSAVPVEPAQQRPAKWYQLD